VPRPPVMRYATQHARSLSQRQANYSPRCVTSGGCRGPWRRAPTEAPPPPPSSYGTTYALLQSVSTYVPSQLMSVPSRRWQIHGGTPWVPDVVTQTPILDPLHATVHDHSRRVATRALTSHELPVKRSMGGGAPEEIPP